MAKAEGIMIFKDTMEYLINGYITAEQYAELTKLIYYTKWGNGVEEDDIKDREILLIWKTLKHSVLKSVRNSKSYSKQNTNNNQDIQPNTEFEITPNEPVKTEEYPNPQPKIESPSEGQEMGKNEVTETKNETVRETVEKLDWMMDVDEVEYKPINLEKHPELDFLREDDEPQEKEQEKEKWMENFEGVRYESLEYYKLLDSITKDYPSITRDKMIRKVENHYKSIEAA